MTTPFPIHPTEAACRAAIHAAAAAYLPRRCQERQRHVSAFLLYRAASAGVMHVGDAGAWEARIRELFDNHIA